MLIIIKNHETYLSLYFLKPLGLDFVSIPWESCSSQSIVKSLAASSPTSLPSRPSGWSLMSTAALSPSNSFKKVKCYLVAQYKIKKIRPLLVLSAFSCLFVAQTPKSFTLQIMFRRKSLLEAQRPLRPTLDYGSAEMRHFSEAESSCWDRTGRPISDFKGLCSIMRQRTPAKKAKLLNVTTGAASTTKASGRPIVCSNPSLLQPAIKSC